MATALATPDSWIDYTRQGQVFMQSATPLGLAIPIYTATAIAGAMPIWNPPNSGIDVELLVATFGYGSGTAVYGSIGLMTGSVAAIGTGTGCSAFAATTPMNGYILRGYSSRVSSSNAGTVTVTAGTAAYPVAGVAGCGWTMTLAAINLEAVTGTAHGTLVPTYNFRGTAVLPPGTFCYFACTLASVALFATSVVWREVPSPAP